MDASSFSRIRRGLVPNIPQSYTHNEIRLGVIEIHCTYVNTNEPNSIISYGTPQDPARVKMEGFPPVEGGPITESRFSLNARQFKQMVHTQIYGWKTNPPAYTEVEACIHKIDAWGLSLDAEPYEPQRINSLKLTYDFRTKLFPRMAVQGEGSSTTRACASLELPIEYWYDFLEGEEDLFTVSIPPYIDTPGEVGPSIFAVIRVHVATSVFGVITVPVP